MIVIYTNQVTNRLNYVLNVLFKYVLGTNFHVTTSVTKYQKYQGLKLNYSPLPLKGGVQIQPVNLLFEKGIQRQNITVDWVDGIPYFFKNQQQKYDVLAASFWMLTRYEEYLPATLDQHQRFKAEETLAYQQGFLKLPVVNLWMLALQKELGATSINFTFPKRKFSVLNTLDIDTAYFSRGKTKWWFWMSWLKDVLVGKKEEAQAKLTYVKTKKDVFDTFDVLEKLSQNVPTHYFFLLGNPSKYDHNIRYNKKCLQQLIQHIAAKYPVGIHPSYVSNTNPKIVAKEKLRLTQIIGKQVTTSRQHYLKLKMPYTYERLIAQQINVDYSMGFASQVGFRAGICNAYPFYNLKLEQERPLFLVPFQVMDGTLREYLKQSPEQAIQEIKQMLATVKKVDGLFVSIWHNSSLSEKFGWKGWKSVYQEMLTLMASLTV